MEQENAGLHQAVQEINQIEEEKMKISSELTQLQADHEGLVAESEYYKNDLVPTMRQKNTEMQKKFKEFDMERKTLQ